MGKNEFFQNHSPLFRSSDLTEAPYRYADTVVVKDAFVRPLRDTVRRLEMLGYTPDACQRMFSRLEEPPTDKSGHELTWDEYVAALHRIDLATSAEHRQSLDDYINDGHSVYVLDPYVALRMLAEKPDNLDLPVVWEFADLVEGGWLDLDSVYTGVDREHVRLVVTEGSSDGAILCAALPLVAGDIDDFFDFIDMADNYPFTGTGNLLRFCQGLARIAVRNRLLVVLDNDTAGREVYERLRGLSLPESMVITTLPDMDICRKVPTLGPNGAQQNDVNGRAVSIECFLDI